jgi:hypothetical protein
MSELDSVQKSPAGGATAVPAGMQRYVPAVGPRLKKWLAVVFGLFALLAVNSTYLASITALESWTGRTYQNWFYLNMFLVHLALGLLIIGPILVFGIGHWRAARHRRNRRAVRVGYALFAVALLILVSGIVLTRVEGVIVVKDATVRQVAYWAHVLLPLIAIWLFVLHRLAGKRIQWQVGRRWAYVAGGFTVVLVAWQAQDPRQWNEKGPASGEQYFFPSLARTATGNFIPARVLDNDEYCLKCHEDSYKGWNSSVHRFSSFNNEPYSFSVGKTRDEMAKRARLTGVDKQGARFCAGCHDPVVFFSGQFDRTDIDFDQDPTGQAGITCTVCHGITHINSSRGNADYTLEEPTHYPFAFSESKSLQWVNEQLVKAKPEFHKKTFLKPLHSTAEFCGSCHKVHLPPELNEYKWLRGQNHYDSYHLSGVSGHFANAFYYPQKAEHNCNGCHMALQPSEQFGAKDLDASGQRKIHDHLFPSANTAIPYLEKLEPWVNEAHRKFNEAKTPEGDIQSKMRVDIFALKEGGSIDAPAIAPLRPEVPTLAPGGTYLLDVVVRTNAIGHPLTQGTADSNEIWLDLQMVEERADGSSRVIGRSGGLGSDNEVDPYSHFLNVYMLDRHGRRIDRRNAEDIFVPLYNHQIPPGAADTLHYRFQVPSDVEGALKIEARLLYRKFDTTYMQMVMAEKRGQPDWRNELPILKMGEDAVTLPVRGSSVQVANEAPKHRPLWQRWNDYGIGLLRKGGKSKGELKQAEAAFAEVEKLGRSEGPINLTRVYLAQGTVQDKAVEAMRRAAAMPEAYPWSVAWFTGQVNKQNGFLDEAIANFRSVVELDDALTRERQFDFSQDYLLLNELGQTLYERAKQERADPQAKERFLREAVATFDKVLLLDAENATAHYNLDLLHKQLGDRSSAARHLELYRKYKEDDNARDRAIAIARAADPAANHAAEAIVIYDLQRAGAFEHDQLERKAARYELRPSPASEAPSAVPPKVAAAALGPATKSP